MKKCLVCGTKLADFCIVDVCGECVLKDIEQHKKETNHRNMIEAELAKAKAKHPNFCDIYKSEADTKEKRILENIRQYNATHANAHYILGEEIYEASEAHGEGRLDDCLVELAQCGAVVLRMMEFVQSEIDAKKGGE